MCKSLFNHLVRLKLCKVFKNHRMEEEGEKVFLYIYDLSQGMAREITTNFLGNTIEGVWHSGIGLFGKEYFYGAGIQCVPIGRSPFGAPVEVLELGITHIPKDIFEEFLHEIGPRYTVATYSLLSHNCNNFTDEAAQFLVGSGIPHHILRQTDLALNNPLGALMLPMLQQLETTLLHGGILMTPRNSFGGSSVHPNPTTPRSTSEVSATRESVSTFPAPFPPLTNSVAPTINSTTPTSPRRSDQNMTNNLDRGADTENNKEK
ncbi:hypothetical protein M758_4G238400 [Ceratodon purpureus]|nr:hypothetical protein M758_4G238400 [Ceratodon purpureus]